MKYCNGNCRHKYIISERTAHTCPYNRIFTVDRDNKDDKNFEICMKIGFLENISSWFWKTFFPELVNLNSLTNGSRKSKLVSINRDNFLQDRN